MAKTTKGAPGEALDLEALDKVVGGATNATDTTKKGGLFGLIDALDQAVVQTGTKAVEAIDQTKTQMADTVKLSNAASALDTDIVRATSGKSGSAAAGAMEDVIRSSAKSIASSMGVTQAEAESMAWAAAYKSVFEGGSASRVSAGALEAMKSDLRAHVGDVCKGMANEVAFVGNLKGSLGRASDAMADAIAKAGPAAESEITAKGKAAFETGLELAKKHPVGKAVMAALEDPKNTDAWSRVVSEVAVSKAVPFKGTVVKFLLEGMTSQAVAKAVGLGDFPAPVKQTAAALVKTWDNVERAVVDLHSKSFVEGMTFGLGIKGIVDIGVNCAELGKAMVSGDTAAMGRAAQALVTDAFTDMKDGLNRAYVQGAAKAFDYTKAITMDLLNGLGATPYAEVAVRETAKALTEFGNMAKNGSVAAVNAIADFAKHDVAGAGAKALSEIHGIAKTTGAAAETAVNALSDVAKSGAKQAESAVNALIDVGRSGSKYATQAVNTLGDVAKSGAGQASYAAYALIDMSRAGAAYASQAMVVLGDVAKSPAKAGAIAIEGLTDVAKSGAKYAESAIYTLIDVSRNAAVYANSAMDALGSVAKSGAAQAQLAVGALTDLSKAGAKYASYAVDTLGGVAKSGVGQAAYAVEGLASVAKSGASYAVHAVDTLGDVGRSGLHYANVAIDALKSVNTAEAGRVLKGLADSGIDYAKSAWNSVRDFFGF